jgi:hypothetical protein
MEIVPFELLQFLSLLDHTVKSLIVYISKVKDNSFAMDDLNRFLFLIFVVKITNPQGFAISDH